MRLNFIQSLIIVAMVALATQITRWTPFLVFSGSRKLPRVVEDLGRLLPPAMMGLLVVYSLRNTDILSGSHGLPEAIAVTVRRSPPVETQHPAVHFSGHRRIHAAGAAGVRVSRTVQRKGRPSGRPFSYFPASRAD